MRPELICYRTERGAYVWADSKERCAKISAEYGLGGLTSKMLVVIRGGKGLILGPAGCPGKMLRGS